MEMNAIYSQNDLGLIARAFVTWCVCVWESQSHRIFKHSSIATTKRKVKIKLNAKKEIAVDISESAITQNQAIGAVRQH